MGLKLDCIGMLDHLKLLQARFPSNRQISHITYSRTKKKWNKIYAQIFLTGHFYAVSMHTKSNPNNFKSAFWNTDSSIYRNKPYTESNKTSSHHWIEIRSKCKHEHTFFNFKHSRMATPSLYQVTVKPCPFIADMKFTITAFLFKAVTVFRNFILFTLRWSSKPFESPTNNQFHFKRTQNRLNNRPPSHMKPGKKTLKANLDCVIGLNWEVKNLFKNYFQISACF